MQAMALETPIRRFVSPGRSLLTVAGHGLDERSLGLDELLAFERHELGPTQVNCFSGRPIVAVQSFAGARLTDILDEAGLASQPRSVLKRCVLVAGAADGHRVAFSWNELYNTGIGEGVLVLFERDRRPLGEDLGPLSLISAGDRQLGPRHLKQLRTLHLHRI